MAHYQLQTTLLNILGGWVVPLILLMTTSACKTTEVRPSQSLLRDTAGRSAPLPREQLMLNSGTSCSFCILRGSLDVHTPAVTANGSFTIHLAQRDSLEGTVYGPFGIVAARAYCTRDELVILDMLAMEAYTAQLPLPDTLRRFFLPLSSEDVFALLRCELPRPDSCYHLMGHRTEYGTTLYLCRGSTFVDIAEISPDGTLRAYQRKTLDNRLLFSIEYGNYRHWATIRYPERIRIAAPAQELEVVLEPSEIAEIEEQTPFRFRLPRNVRRIPIE